MLEDLQASVGKLTNLQQSDLTTFLTKSRHKSLSILYIVHRFPFNQRGSDFDKAFFENMTHIAIFKFLQNNLHVNLWAGRVFNEKVSSFKEAFQLAHKVSEYHGHSRPYILVTLGWHQFVTYFYDPFSYLKQNIIINLYIYTLYVTKWCNRSQTTIGRPFQDTVAFINYLTQIKQREISWSPPNHSHENAHVAEHSTLQAKNCLCLCSDIINTHVLCNLWIIN